MMFVNNSLKCIPFFIRINNKIFHLWNIYTVSIYLDKTVPYNVPGIHSDTIRCICHIFCHLYRNHIYRCNCCCKIYQRILQKKKNRFIVTFWGRFNLYKKRKKTFEIRSKWPIMKIQNYQMNNFVLLNSDFRV